MHKLLVIVVDVLSYHYNAVGMGSEFSDVVDIPILYLHTRSLTLVIIFVSRVNAPKCI